MQHPPKRMIKKKAGRKWLLLAMLVLLALSIAFVALLPYLPKTTVTVEEAPMTETIALSPVEDLVSVTITPEIGEPFTLHMQEGTFQLDGGETISESYAQDLLDAFTHLVSEGMVAEDAAELDLAQLGLAEPSASAVMRYADGSEAKLMLGTSVPNTAYTYCMWSGSPAVYMCGPALVDALNLTANRLRPVEQPIIYGELLNSLTISNANGYFEMVFDEVPHLSAPVVYPLAADMASDLQTALSNFRLGTREDDGLYSFDDPLCVIELEQSSGVVSEVDADGQVGAKLVSGQKLRFVIGQAEGEFFYTCQYEGGSYLISRFLVQTLVNLKQDSLVTRNPADVGDLALRNIYIESPDGTADMQITRTERVLPNNELEVDENGDVVIDTTVLLNGAQSTPEMLDEVVSRLDALTVSGNVPANWVSQGEPRWRIVLQLEEGLVRTVEAWRLDLFADVIAVDGVALHCVDGEAIEVITEGLFQMSTAARDH